MNDWFQQFDVPSPRRLDRAKPAVVLQLLLSAALLMLVVAPCQAQLITDEFIEKIDSIVLIKQTEITQV